MVGGPFASLGVSGVGYDQMENFFRHKMPRFLKPGKYQGADSTEQVFGGGCTGTTGLPEGFAELLAPLSGQSTEGSPNMSDGLLEALAGQMSTQDNASMMAASGLPIDTLKLDSSSQPSLAEIMAIMGVKEPPGGWGSGYGVLTDKTKPVGAGMQEFMGRGYTGDMTNPFGYGGYDEVGSMLAGRMGRGSPRGSREFGVYGREGLALNR